MKRLLTFLILVSLSTVLSAQDQIEMADAMRSEGKIYVVVAILLVILFGLIGYLILLDRKISKVEKRLKS